ncbi:MAG: hypothetical protein J0I20_15595 [Chloroflexi bacterium]|nr:hypothetical protein [Chloroflexota bacterium]OJV91270.1 MAG: hypothetical protein BGO39_26865 [Chloroflexi bacterium 54-19]
MSTNQLLRCARHPNEEARMMCGDCGNQMCTICMTLTGEGPRCPDCMAAINNGFARSTRGQGQAQAQPVEGVILPAGDASTRQDAAREAYYATEPVVTYCARHPNVETLLRCGRCNTPICPRCMVHSGVGIRCPDCAANPQRTIGLEAERAAAAARGQKPPEENTGFRNYWSKGRAYQKVYARHYILAALAGLGTAIALGLVWGFLLDATRLTVRGIPRGGFTGALTTDQLWTSLIIGSVQSSIHLIPEIALGLLVGAAISWATQNRVGPGLQLIAGLSVVVGILVSLMTVGARIFSAVNGGFPPFDRLLSASFNAMTQQISGNGLGILIFWVIAIGFAVYRLKR